MPSFSYARPVFILGAGFSFHATRSFGIADASPLPLLPELSERVRASDVVPEHIQALGANFEEWLTYLATNHPWIKPDGIAANRAVFLQLSREIAETILMDLRPFKEAPVPHWLGELVTAWHNRKADVITLNYDTLIESLSSRLLPSNRRSAGVFYPAPIPRGAVRLGGTFAPPAVETTNIYKLHGSANWYRSGLYPEQPIYYTDTTWELLNDAEIEDMGAVADLEPFIVPPALDKTGYLQHDTMRHLWWAAGEAVRGADALVVLGYSLPDTDTAMHTFLKSHAPAQRIPLFVVDRSVEAAERYRLLLDSHYEIDSSYTGEAAIEDCVAAYAG